MSAPPVNSASRPASVINTAPALAQAIEHWKTQRALALDTESNSFYAYRERTCLVQVSTREADWIVDPLAVDLAPMAPLMTNPAIEKVLHASENDIVSFNRDYGFVVVNMFDTLVAAKSLGRKKVGLGNLLQEVLGVVLTKDEQRSDWGKRPLSADQIEYAYADTRFLLQLADALKAEVAKAGAEMIEEVATDCVRLAAKEGKTREVDAEAFEHHKLARKLDPVARQVLKSLFEAREKRGREMDRAVFRILPEDTLGEIAARRPESRSELSGIPGVSPGTISRHGDMILEAVKLGVAAGPLPYVRRQTPTPDPREEKRYEALRSWRRQLAEGRGVEVDVIAGNAALHVIAKAAPNSIEALAALGAIDAYRLRRYGPAILAKV